MTTTIVKPKMTLEEFVNYEDNTDYLYELTDGELIQMPMESEVNLRIGSFWFGFLIRSGLADYRLSLKTEIGVPRKMVNVCVPDLVVFSEELPQAMESAKRSLDMPNPALVVGVVSLNQDSRNYRFKRTGYCARGIGGEA